MLKYDSLFFSDDKNNDSDNRNSKTCQHVTNTIGKKKTQLFGHIIGHSDLKRKKLQTCQKRKHIV